MKKTLFRKIWDAHLVADGGSGPSPPSATRCASQILRKSVLFIHFALRRTTRTIAARA